MSTALNCLLLLAGLPGAAADEPRTAAERSDYKLTSSHEEVVAFCQALAKSSPLVRLAELGTSHEGRKLPLVILADPPVASAKDAARSKKLVVFAMANIHAGEVDGKEAVLMLARELAHGKDKALLKELVLVFAPIFNADGNEKLGNNRRAQAGPERVGTRTSAQGLDLNRDFVKLESPEVRALVRFLNEWDPVVVIDCHTTNGSRHRYALTYEGGRCPAGDPRVIEYARDELLPDVTRRLQKATGQRSTFYGNFSADRTLWETVPPTPRYGTHYVGLRNRIAILSESYSYAPFKERVQASQEFVRAICAHTAANAAKVRKLLDEARQATLEAGKAAKGSVVLQQRAVPLGRPVTILGFVEEVRNGRRVSTGQPKAYEVRYTGGSEATLSVRRPWAYLFPADLKDVAANLRRHGIAVEELSANAEVEVEVYKVEKVTRGRAFQKHQPVSVKAAVRKERRRAAAGNLLVRTGQPLGSLAAYLLEPQSADGLLTWNYFDAVLGEGKDFPVVRVPAPAALKTRQAP
jgi:hypothetical protein